MTRYAATFSFALIVSSFVGCGEANRVASQVTKLGGNVSWVDGKLDEINLYGTKISDAQLAELASSKALASLKRLNLGKTQISDDVLVCLRQLPQLEHLLLHRTNVGDDGLAHVETLVNLQSISLDDVPITDVGLQRLSQLSKLQTLGLSGTKMTDVGLQHLLQLSGLQYLDLSRTKITDAGAVKLASMTALTDLTLGKTSVTDRTFDFLQRSLPNCLVHRDTVEERFGLRQE